MEQLLTTLKNEFEQELFSLDLPSSPSNLYEPMRYILALGGKRIRPILTLLGCELMGRPYKEAMNQALAVEIFHNFTLVHDDIMDSAEVRRKLPTVHKKWDPNIALLSGDGMIVLAYQKLFDAPEDKLKPLGEIFSKTALEVCEGQQLDMDYAERDMVGIDDYLEMIRLKTAVLLGGAMQLGAIIGGATESQLNNIQVFAEDLGLAFQIKDDVLDSFGDPEHFGKEIGGDIREGKRTWLTIKTNELASEEDKRSLQQAYVNEDIESRIATVIGLYEKYDVKTLAENEVERLSQESLNALRSMSASQEVETKLEGLVAYLMGRLV